jgi:hypothetical protein
MEREFLDYTEALALKELGFDEPCFAFYNNLELKRSLVRNFEECKNSDWDAITAPLYQQAFSWFREKYDLFGIILPYLITGNQWYYKITNRNNSSGLPFEEGFETYEEAELECLIKLIEIVKEKLWENLK